MKKSLAIVLVAIMVIAFAACSANTEKDDNKDKSDSTTSTSDINVDMSKYPADFKDWTAQNLVDYFNEAVNFPSGCETWVQNHAEYWANYPIYEVSGIWSDKNAIENVVVMFTVFNPDSPDTTPEAVEAVQKAIREDKNHDYTTEDIFLGAQDHMVDHVALSYKLTTNEKVCREIEDAYNYLVETMGVTPDF